MNDFNPDWMCKGECPAKEALREQLAKSTPPAADVAEAGYRVNIESMSDREIVDMMKNDHVLNKIRQEMLFCQAVQDQGSIYINVSPVEMRRNEFIAAREFMFFAESLIRAAQSRDVVREDVSVEELMQASRDRIAAFDNASNGAYVEAAEFERGRLAGLIDALKIFRGEKK